MSLVRLSEVVGGVAWCARGRSRTSAVACPVLMHFGEKDHAIPLSDVEKVRSAHPSGVEVHVYPWDHGFICDERGSYDAESARTAPLAYGRVEVPSCYS